MDIKYFIQCQEPGTGEWHDVVGPVLVEQRDDILRNARRQHDTKNLKWRSIPQLDVETTVLSGTDTPTLSQ